MAIFQDLEGDKAGGSLPYLQTPAHASPGPEGEARIAFSSGIQRLGTQLSGIAASGIKYKEQKKRKEEQEKYNRQLSIDPMEKQRREYFERSRSLSVQKYKSEFFQRATEAQKGFNGVDASIKFRTWMSSELSSLQIEADDIGSIEDPFLSSIIDNDVMPNANTAMAVDKGHLTWEEATGHDKIRLVNQLHDDLLDWAARQEPKLLAVEQKAALDANSEASTELFHNFMMGCEAGNVANSVSQFEAVLHASSDLYKDVPEAHVDTLTKHMSIGVPQIGIGASKGMGRNIRELGNDFLFELDGTGGASPNDKGSSWGEIVQSRGSFPLSDEIRSKTVAGLADTFVELEKIKSYATDPLSYAAYNKSMEAVKEAIAREIIDSIGNISSYMAPMKLPAHANMSVDTNLAYSGAMSYGQHVVSDPVFILAVTKYLGPEHANKISKTNYGFNIALYRDPSKTANKKPDVTPPVDQGGAPWSPNLGQEL